MTNSIRVRQWLTAVFFLLCIPALSEAQRLRPEEEASETLAGQWRNVAHLPNGFPADFQPELAAAAPDGKGGSIEFGTAPTAEQLADLYTRIDR